MGKFMLASILILGTICAQINAGVLSVSTSSVDSMLRNPVVVQRHIRCLQCKGQCDRIGEELKVVIPRIVATQCRQCSATERANMGKIINVLQSQYPNEWADLNVQMRSGRRAC